MLKLKHPMTINNNSTCNIIINVQKEKGKLLSHTFFFNTLVRILVLKNIYAMYNTPQNRSEATMKHF